MYEFNYRKAASLDEAKKKHADAENPSYMSGGMTLLPTLKDSGTLAVMSSQLGSIADSSGGFELYRTSKAALNMLAKGISEQQAKERKIEVLSLHPGWVQTDMGGPNATLTIDESVTGLADVLESPGGKGFRYVDYAGEALPF